MLRASATRITYRNPSGENFRKHVVINVPTCGHESDAFVSQRVSFL
jgi:hypothetical protein